MMIRPSSDVGYRLMSLHDFISHSPGVEVALGARPSQCTHWHRFQMLYRWGHRFPDWTFGFKQSSFTPIARVLRHLTLQHFRVIIAFAACCCSLGLSAPGQPVTQEHSSKFLLVAPGISSCVTWRTLAVCRVDTRRGALLPFSECPPPNVSFICFF